MAAAAWRCRWLGLAFLCCATPVLADQLDTSNTAARVPARQVLIDHNHLRVEAVLSDATLPWRDGTRTANPGITRATFWTWFVVTPADAARVLTIDNPLLDTATVYVADGTHIISRTRFGTAQPFAMRIFRSDPDFTVEVPPADRPLTVLIEARAIGSLRAVPELRTRDAYRAHLTATALIRGVYYGTLVVMVLYNIGLAISLKDRAYSFYVAIPHRSCCCSSRWTAPATSTCGRSPRPGRRTASCLPSAPAWASCNCSPATFCGCRCRVA